MVRDGGGTVVPNSDGTPQLILDGNGRPQPHPANPGAAAALRKHVGTIDTLRHLTSTFSQQLGDANLPQP